MKTESVAPVYCKATKLERLKCWPEVKAMIQNSRPLSDIVRFIQDDRKEYLDVKPGSLYLMIRYWIQRNQDKLIDCQIPTKYLNLLDNKIERIDPLDGLNMIFAIHMDRIMIDYAKERKASHSAKENTSNLRLANDMLKAMSELKQNALKQHMPNENKPGTKSLKETFESIDRVKKMYEERFGSVPAAVALNPESRAKVYSAISRIRRGDSEPILELLKSNSEKLRKIKEEEQAQEKTEIVKDVEGDPSEERGSSA